MAVVTKAVALTTYHKFPWSIMSPRCEHGQLVGFRLVAFDHAVCLILGRLEHRATATQFTQGVVNQGHVFSCASNIRFKS